MKHVHVCAFFLMSFFHTSCGQNQTNVPKDNINYDIKDTVTSQVPYSMVRNVKQDRNGNILIASYKGVFRYDGKSFTNITSKISSPSFWDVLEDRKGNLWFATRNSGVYYYNGKTFQHFTTREGLANNRVLCIYEDRAGIIWFGTGGGISRYDGKTFTVFRNKDGKAFNNVWSIIEDKKGNIWLGDSDGLWRYDGSAFTKVSQRGVYAIIEDKKGNIWTTGSVNPPGGRVWALSRYDQKSLYNKKPTVTEIMSLNGTGMLCGILEANDISKGELMIEKGQLVGGRVEVDMNTIEDKNHGSDNEMVNHLKNSPFLQLPLPGSNQQIMRTKQLRGT